MNPHFILTSRGLCGAALLAVLAAAGLAADQAPPISATRPAAAPDAPTPVIELEPGDAGPMWSLNVDSVGGLLSAVPQFWGAKFTWAPVKFATQKRKADGGLPFIWDVESQGLTGQGTMRLLPADKVQWEWRLEAAKDMPAEGQLESGPHGGLTCKLKLDSPVRHRCQAEPVLKDDKTGFDWEILPGKIVTVSFAAPLANLYFERGQKNEIRAVFYGGQIKSGRLDLTMTVTLPAGTPVLPTKSERYGADTKDWCVNALDLNASFVDLSYLNDKPAGKHGFVEAKGPEFTFPDGTPVRFWSTAIVGPSLFVHDKSGQPDKALIDRQAKRLAALGFNMVRIHQQDTNWSSPNMIAKGQTTDKLDDQAMDAMFYWIKALKEQGLYVWVDMISYRVFLPGDGIPHFEEMKPFDPKQPDRRRAEGFSYLNPRIKELWQITSKELVTRVNPYTGLAMKDDPAVAGLMIWNENDFTGHFGLSFLAANSKNAPWHRQLYVELEKAFAAKTGLAVKDLASTWLPGAGKLLLNDIEYNWNHEAVEYLHGLGVKVPICAGHLWGNMPLYCMPALTAGDVIDSHSYSPPEFLQANPRYAGNFAAYIAMAHLADRPSMITEYNIDAGNPGFQLDNYTVMPYVATLGAFHQWGMANLAHYSENGFSRPETSPWDSYSQPQTMGLAPAAALLFRAGHVRPAQKTIFLSFSRRSELFQEVSDKTSLTLRTVAERHRLTVGLGAVKELPWLKATPQPAGSELVTDLDHDYIPPGDEVTSDTGEFTRNWVKGTFLVNTPKTQLAMGALKGQNLRTADVGFAITTPHAAVAFSSLDGQPLKQSRRILLSTAARVAMELGKAWNERTIRSEPVAGQVTLASTVPSLNFIPLKGDGTKMDAIPLESKNGVYVITLPTDKGTHWFVLEAADLPH